VLSWSVNADPRAGSRDRIRQVLGLALLGATVGTLFDWEHVVHGAIAYTRPVPLGIAWWTPLLYSGAALAIGLSHPMADRWLERLEVRPRTPLRLATAMICFLGIWYATGALPLSSAIVAALLMPPSLGVWWAFDATRAGLAMAITTALAGVGVEATLVGLGVFRHRSPDVFGVAWWLPSIYIAGSVAVGNVGRVLAPRRDRVMGS